MIGGFLVPPQIIHSRGGAGGGATATGRFLTSFLTGGPSSSPTRREDGPIPKSAIRDPKSQMTDELFPRTVSFWVG